MFILSCSWVRLVECRGIESQALKAQILPSRPEEFHLQPLTDSVREHLDSYGSCRPSLQNLSTLELRNKPKLLSFPIALGILYKSPTFRRKARIKLVPPIHRMPPNR